MYSTIKKYQVNDTEYTFVCRSRSTCSGFAHDAELQTANGYVIGTASCHYINRTWESYTYQSAMIAVVREKIDAFIRIATRQFKEKQGISRITAKRKPELEAYIANERKSLILWRELDQLLDMIK